MTDEEREAEINRLKSIALTALVLGDMDAYDRNVVAMCAEINRRSPEQVRLMEEERGLAQRVN